MRDYSGPYIIEILFNGTWALLRHGFDSRTEAINFIQYLRDRSSHLYRTRYVVPEYVELGGEG